MSLVIVLIALAVGALLLDAVKGDLPLLVRLGAGFCVGLTLFGLVGFFLALIFGLNVFSLTLSMILLAAPLFMPRNDARWKRLGADGRALFRSIIARPSLALCLAVASVALVAVVSRAIYVRDGAVFTGDVHNLGDLPFHMAIVSSFVHGENFPPEHPELAGARLTYPFLLDFNAAQIVRSGASIPTAFLLQNSLLVLALLALLIHFARRITGSEKAAFFAPWLVLLNGGFGFMGVLADARGSGRGILALLTRLPRDYTMQPEGPLRWGNSLMTLFIPQRTLLLGLPLALLALALLHEACAEKNAERRRRLMIGAGAAAGLLPLVHMHSFAVVVISAACLTLLFPRFRDWLAFFAASGSIAAPQLLFLFLGSSMRARSFVEWHVGWDRGTMNPFVFWLLNTGLFIPLLAVALLWRGRRPIVSGASLRFVAPFALFFVVPNLLRLSPWIWDNIKFLFFFWVATAPLVAALLARLWRPGQRIFVGALFFVLVASGALDATRVLTRAAEQRVFDARSLAFAAMLRNVTPPRALVLHVPTYNHPVLLSGRRSLLGYPGHIPSQGLDAGNRESEIGRVYAGAHDASELIARHEIDFIVVGPGERSALRVNDAFLANFPLVGETGGYQLHRVAGN